MSKPAENIFNEWMDIQRKIAEKQQELTAILTQRTQSFATTKQRSDPMGLQNGLMQYWAYMMRDPEKAVKGQMDLYQKQYDLMHNTVRRLQGEELEPLIPLDSSDRRFRDPRWTQNPLFDHMRQSYTLMTNWYQARTDEMAALDPAMARKMRFALQQYMNAFSPSNFWMTNPEVLEETLKTKGENLLKGMQNMIDDLKSSHGMPRISMVKQGMFEVGKNLATTPGKVVFQNALLQVIQYEPTTPKVYKTPLVIVSPWINKYYILDMQPENSFVKWAVDQGHTVFMTSWVNPTEKHRDISFTDYMHMGMESAIETAQKATGEKQVNVIGYCIGGTLLTTLLAYYKAKKKTSPVKSATFFTALIDFEDAGDLTLFTDEAQISAMEDMMAEKGYLDAWHLHTTFNMLRANDLIWSFVVNNYLLGREPFPFDLLYWNSDSTGIPAAAHSFYLRQMYLYNHLSRPGKLVIDDTAINVNQIDTPSYFISTIDDHIAPWKATYTGAKLFNGDVTFTLAGSGHIAGVVNPPIKNKYQYWTNNNLPNGADEWFDGAKQSDGSWWPHWAKWIAKYGGAKVTARKPGTGALKAIENAPGSYVEVRAL